MPTRTRPILVAACLLFATAQTVVAQSAPPLFDPTQLPELRGTVRHYTLTPRGDIDGFVLEDGTEVNLPPHLTPEVAFAIRPGDAVTIYGLRARALPLVAATSVRNDATGRTVVDRGPRHGARDEAERTVSGAITTILHGPRGEVNGVMLDGGMTVRLPPDESANGPAGLAVGRAVTVRGPVLESLLGSVLDATAIGPDEAGLATIRRPDGRGAERPRAPPPPPPGAPRP